MSEKSQDTLVVWVTWGSEKATLGYFGMMQSPMKWYEMVILSLNKPALHGRLFLFKKDFDQTYKFAFFEG